MSTSDHEVNLEHLAAIEVAGLLLGVEVGSELDIAPAHDLLSVLELLIPQVLRHEYAEWETESIDGFFLASAIKSTQDLISLAGTCILISDQTVTPFVLDLGLAGEEILCYLRIRLGEVGGGRLGISGPECNSRSADELLASLSARVGTVEWSYDVIERHAER